MGCNKTIICFSKLMVLFIQCAKKVMTIHFLYLQKYTQYKNKMNIEGATKKCYFGLSQLNMSATITLQASKQNFTSSELPHF